MNHVILTGGLSRQFRDHIQDFFGVGPAIGDGQLRPAHLGCRDEGHRVGYLAGVLDAADTPTYVSNAGHNSTLLLPFVLRQ